MKNNFIPSLLFSLFIITSATHADEISSGEKHVKPNAQQSKSIDEKRKQKPVTQNIKTEPAKKFIPTEKLRADDVVKFPVDI